MDTTSIFTDVGSQRVAPPLHYVNQENGPSVRSEFSSRARMGLDELKALSPDAIFDHSIQVFEDSGCDITESEFSDGTCTAVYVPFIYEPDDHGVVFKNRIVIENAKKRSWVDMKLSRYHEEVHLEQWNTVLDLLASPYNNASPYVLCPEDWVVATILTERDAYTKGTMKAFLHGGADVRKACETSLVSVEALEEFCRTSPDLRTALDKAGDFAMSKIKLKMKDSDPTVTIFQHYCKSAMDDYKSSERLDDKVGIVKYGRPIFVRLGADATKIGETSGVKGFRSDFQGLVAEIISKLPSEVREWIKEENLRWGIKGKNDLPTMEQAIAQDGYTRESFIQHCREYTWKPAGTEAEVISAPQAA